MSQIVRILAIKNGDQGGFFPEDRLPDPEDIRVICSSLISFSAADDETFESTNTNSNDNGSVVSMQNRHMSQIQLAHFSVKKYLLSERCAPTWGFEAQTCHQTMTEACLHYLLQLAQKAPLTEETVQQYPLALYAAEYWWQHAQKVDITSECSVYKLASRLLNNKDTALLVWVQLYDIDQSWCGSDLTREISHVSQPLYYATLTGLPEIVCSIQCNVDINAQGGGYGNALQAASSRGNEKIVQMLLDAGAERQDEDTTVH